jgi:hypothetical protein
MFLFFLFSWKKVKKAKRKKKVKSKSIKFQMETVEEVKNLFMSAKEARKLTAKDNDLIKLLIKTENAIVNACEEKNWEVCITIKNENEAQYLMGFLILKGYHTSMTWNTDIRCNELKISWNQ